MVNNASDDWAQGFEEDHRDSHVLRSFPSIRSKTLFNLYGQTDDNDKEALTDTKSNLSKERRDKSLKGSVDEAILPLVNLINLHSSFATCSSCSGRISLFDPGLRNDDLTNNTSDGRSISNITSPSTQTDPGDEQRVVDSGSGKGSYGGWIFVSHDYIKTETLLEALSNTSTQRRATSEATSHSIMTLRFEPMILHVAAANVERGQQLLQLALQLGFRESGLVVTTTRVTVAIRGYSLALAIPLARSGPLELSTEYLDSFVQEVNARLTKNLNRIHQLQNGFLHEFFHRKRLRMYVDTFDSLPTLGLWGHASVVFQPTSGCEITVFGGYGTGPYSLQSGPRRSNKVYKLVQDGEHWADAWEEVSVDQSPKFAEGTRHICHSVESIQCSFGPREGLRAIVWDDRQGKTEDASGAVALLFGGRTNPSNPLQDLVIYDRTLQSFFKPADVRGKPPSPRWGHSWTQLNGNQSGSCQDIGFLAGGRNESATLSDAFILSIVTEGDTVCHFLWTQVELDTWVPRPRFHHTCTSSKDGKIIIMGGLSSSNHLLGVDEYHLENHAFGEMLQVDENKTCVQDLSSVHLAPMFGQSSCVLSALPVIQDDVFVSIGGLLVHGSDGDESESLIQAFVLEKGMHHTKNMDWTIQPVQVVVKNTANVSFGSLIHASCHPILGTKDDPESKAIQYMAVIGGGVQGFAFGPQFADSFLLSVQVCEEGQTATGDVRKPVAAHRKSKTDRPSSMSPKEPSSSADQETDVVFVFKRDAKKLRVKLEQAGWLDKRYRMTPAAPTDSDEANVDNFRDYIAVPIMPQARSVLSQDERIIGVQGEASTGDNWHSLVHSVGTRKMPLSTANFASQRT